MNDDDKYLLSEFLGVENDFYANTENLVEQLMEFGTSEIPMLEFRCSEIFTLRHKLDLFMTIKSDFYHYEIASLISFWDSLFIQIKEIVTENGRNTSWLSSKFENFKGQHEIVDLMVREQLKSMSN
ncbi:hypothetical protein RO490_07530 [Lactococcus petauri]|uniref:hypothetical protein n=1 Tax=Lactococcus TaxID=1357 RepID=UPI00254C9487|nr:hypothetical protein [Lactococcus garvieae]MDN5624885.1 hypothetical protein [Acinetobacter sp.]